MAETASNSAPVKKSHRNSKVGEVVSTKMQKTIVIEVIMKKSHPLYRRVVSKSSRFYAHDENGTAKMGDIVRIEETRPLSKLKRWRLTDVVRRATQIEAPEDVLTLEAAVKIGKTGKAGKDHSADKDIAPAAATDGDQDDEDSRRDKRKAS